MTHKITLFFFIALISCFTSVYGQEQLIEELRGLNKFEYKKINKTAFQFVSSIANLATENIDQISEQTKQSIAIMNSIDTIEVIEGPVSDKAFNIINKGMRQYIRKENLKIILKEISKKEPFVIYAKGSKKGYYDEIIMHSNEKETNKITYIKIMGDFNEKDLTSFFKNNVINNF